MIVLSYILVAAVAVGITFCVTTIALGGSAKLNQLERLLETYYIEEVDHAALEDGAAAGMVAALGDQWSYYIPASQYDLYMEQMDNIYVGIGITISQEMENGSVEVLQVEPNGGAKAAGIQVGDQLIAVDGQKIADLGIDAIGELVRGKEGTEVSVTVLRDGQELTIPIIRQIIELTVADGQMLEDNIGYVLIRNFDGRCAQETIAAIEELMAQGAEKLIFDVRFNPGGYKDELVEILDYLLPEGPLFRSIDYEGYEEISTSDKSCLEIPIAVLINGESYSAAEFFAAALEEYDWAITVGEQTGGKGKFQPVFQLNDGSGVGLSIGKYYTPNGVSLADQGGLTPQIPVEVDDETWAKIYGGLIPLEEDPQVIAAIEALK